LQHPRHGAADDCHSYDGCLIGNSDGEKSRLRRPMMPMVLAHKLIRIADRGGD
jgi:hypothetical protein